MKTIDWMLPTHGRPLEALRSFLAAIWQVAKFDGMFVPLYDGVDNTTQAILISDPSRLEEVNPFLPLMSVNNARWIPHLLELNAGKRLGVVLRPCELRALVEMAKHTRLDPGPTLIIGVDCLGTFPASDFLWRAERKGSPGNISDDTLQFARQGGIVPYRYRAACQLCLSPDSRGADLNIGVLGMPVRQSILVQALNPQLSRRLALAELTAGPADPDLVKQRDRMLAKLIERRARTRDRLIQSLGELLPADPVELIEMFNSCHDCQECMQQCPICSVDFPQSDDENNFRIQDIKRWLVSCAGCGMCEQACPQHHPLSAIFGHIRDQLADTFGYTPGASQPEVLPIT